MLKRKSVCVVIFLSVAAVALSGCGRKGDLDRPGVSPAASKAKKGSDTKKLDVEDKPFLLDPLL